MNTDYQENSKGDVIKYFEYVALIDYTCQYHHKHSFWEAIFCTKGKIIHCFKGKEDTLKPGDLVLIKPGEEHFFKDFPDSKHVHFDLYAQPQAFKSICDQIGNDVFSMFLDAEFPIKTKLTTQQCEFLYQKMKKILTLQKIKHSELFINAYYQPCLMEIICQCVRYILTEGKAPSVKFNQFLSEINTLEFLGGPLEDIIAHSHYSHTHLCRLFKKHTGTSMQEYLLKMKMNYAVNLLKDNNLSILNISSMLGYNSLSHFIKMFKKTFHLTPLQYRNQILNIKHSI